MGNVIWGLGLRRTVAVAITSAILAGAAVPALASSTATYRGKSSQHQPVVMVVAGSQIKRLTVWWSAQCPALHAPLKGIKTYHTDVPLTKSAWSTHGGYTAHVSGGYEEKFAVRDHGELSHAGRVTGVFSGTVQIFHGAKHTRIDTCQSGRVTFTLTRAP